MDVHLHPDDFSSSTGSRSDSSNSNSHSNSAFDSSQDSPTDHHLSMQPSSGQTRSAPPERDTSVRERRTGGLSTGQKTPRKNVQWAESTKGEGASVPPARQQTGVVSGGQGEHHHLDEDALDVSFLSVCFLALCSSFWSLSSHHLRSPFRFSLFILLAFLLCFCYHSRTTPSRILLSHLANTVGGISDVPKRRMRAYSIFFCPHPTLRFGLPFLLTIPPMSPCYLEVRL